MKLVSFDSNEPAVFAFGKMPIGIVAIGAMPVGVIAIGNLGAGIVMLSCGAGAGVLSVTCGVAVGLVSGGVGLAFGMKEVTIGLGISVLPAAEPKALHTHEVTTTLTALVRGETHDGWALIPSNLSLDDGRALELADDARAELAQLASHHEEVLAHIEAKDVPVGDAPSGFDYRNAVPTERRLFVDTIVPPPPKPNRWPSLWTFTKGIALLCALAAAGGAVQSRFADLDLNRKAELVWDARVRDSTDPRFAERMPCEVHAYVRTDGKLRHKASLSVSCGGIAFLSRTDERTVDFTESTVAGIHKYVLEYKDPGEAPDTDSDGNETGNTPQVDLATREHRFTMRGWPPHAYAIELDVDDKSRPRTGDALFVR